MAGPYQLAPNEMQKLIPTWPLGKRTKVIVDCQADGQFEMEAGGSAAEINTIRVGRQEFERDFAGAWLAVTNLTPKDITVTTE
jgi:hypothetical protein